jgi:REP element-mobilizing transposase RayT
VTIVTQGRTCLFGDIVNGEMRLSRMGRIVHYEWEKLPIRFPGITLAKFVIMPNHIHGIILIDKSVGATHLGMPTGADLPGGLVDSKALPGPERVAPTAKGPGRGSIGAIMARYKSRVTKRIWADTPGLPVWQRNYYEHVIRDEHDMDDIRAHILNNPANWNLNQENPSASSTITS